MKNFEECLSEYAVILEEEKELKNRKEQCAKIIKNELLSKHQKSIIHDGHRFSISTTQKISVPVKNKDALLVELMSLGRDVLIEKTLNPNVEAIVNASNTDPTIKALSDKYVSNTTIVSLKCI